MRDQFPPMPPRETLRIVDGDLTFRPAEVEDAEKIVQLRTDPRLEFILDSDRPQSAERFKTGLETLHARDATGASAGKIHWVVELGPDFVGYFQTRFDMLDKNGGKEGLLLRSATWQAYFGPEFIRQGIARRMKLGLVEDVIEDTFVRHFGVEQMVGWINDANETACAMVTAYGFEGPLHHNHQSGLGFYRRPTRPLAT